MYSCRTPTQQKTEWQFFDPRVSALSSLVLRVQGNVICWIWKGLRYTVVNISPNLSRSRQIQPRQRASKKCSPPVRLKDKESFSPSKVKLVTMGPTVWLGCYLAAWGCIVGSWKATLTALESYLKIKRRRTQMLLNRQEQAVSPRYKSTLPISEQLITQRLCRIFGLKQPSLIYDVILFSTCWEARVPTTSDKWGSMFDRWYYPPVNASGGYTVGVAGEPA